MPQLTLAQAQTIVSTALKLGMDQKMQPLAVVVLDERGVPKAYAAQDGTSLRRIIVRHRLARLSQTGRRQPALHRRRHACGRRIAGSGPRRCADPDCRQGDRRRGRHLRRQLRQ